MNNFTRGACGVGSGLLFKWGEGGWEGGSFRPVKSLLPKSYHIDKIFPIYIALECA